MPLPVLLLLRPLPSILALATPPRLQGVFIPIPILATWNQVMNTLIKRKCYTQFVLLVVRVFRVYIEDGSQ